MDSGDNSKKKSSCTNQVEYQNLAAMATIPAITCLIFIIGSLAQLCHGHYPVHNNYLYNNHVSDGPNESATTRKPFNSDVTGLPYYSAADLLRMNNYLNAGNKFRNNVYDRHGSIGLGSERMSTPFYSPSFTELMHKYHQLGHNTNQSDFRSRARANIELARLMHLIRLERQLYSIVGQASDNLVTQVITRILQSSTKHSSGVASRTVSKQRLDQLRNAMLQFLFPNTQLGQDFKRDHIAAVKPDRTNVIRTSQSPTTEGTTTTTTTPTTTTGVPAQASFDHAGS